MTDRLKTFWEKYAVQIFTVLVIAIGFYFTTNTRLDSYHDLLLNHELRLKTVEVEIAKNNAILERLEKKVDEIDAKLDRIVEGK